MRFRFACSKPAAVPDRNGMEDQPHHITSIMFSNLVEVTNYNRYINEVSKDIVLIRNLLFVAGVSSLSHPQKHQI